MNPYEIVTGEFTFPFEFHGYQQDAIADAMPLDCVLLRHGVGLGKTAIATAIALLHSIESDVEQIWVIAPPILADQWYEWLTQIPEIDSVTLYRGTPDERLAMPLDDSVIIMSDSVFQGRTPRKIKKGEAPPKVKVTKDKDTLKLKKLADNTKLAIIYDELSVKSLKSKSYRKLKKTLYRKMRVVLEDSPFHKLIALNATPISAPEHVYNWTSLMVPGTYYSKDQFELIHVEKKDHWGRVTKWRDEQLLADNMDLFSVDAPKGSIKLPPIVYDVVNYKLSPEHMGLYNDIEEAKFDALPEDKIELAINSMFSTLQRLILAPDEFELKVRPAILDYIDQYLSVIGNEQVIILTRHVSVSKMLHKYIKGSVAIYGELTKTKKDEALAEFKSGGARRIVANMDSAGVGLNLQFCQRALLAELPFRGDKLEQIVGRIYRQGQEKTCFVSIPMAIGTLQSRIYDNLLSNDDDICRILKNRDAVRKFLDGK